MPVLDITNDPQALTLTMTAAFPKPAERVWQIWADPRQLERWWGPPTWPATVVDHDLTVGGRVRYYMTGPAGDKAEGWWQFTHIDPPRSLEFEDGFSDTSGQPDLTMPTMRIRVDLAPTDDGTLMTVVTTFRSAEQMQQLSDMGMEEGLRGAAGQIDAILAD
jgi:uncharacterized protein YndB with AHSA1/START domain